MKKGTLMDWAADFFAYLFYTMMLIMFFVLFSVTLRGCGDTVKCAAGYCDEVNIVGVGNEMLGNDLLLLNFLRTEVEFEGSTVNMAELIALSHGMKSYNLFETRAKELLAEIDDNMFGEQKCSVVKIVISNNVANEFRTDGCKANVETSYSKTEIPLIGTNEAAQVWLSYASLTADSSYASHRYSSNNDYSEEYAYRVR